MKLTALLAQERREGIEQGREEGVNVFYSSSLRCKKRIPTSCLLAVCGDFCCYYSHSIVEGGLLVISYTIRLM